MPLDQINNGEDGLVVRTKLNDNFTALDPALENFATANTVFAGGAIPTNTPQTIPVATWTPVVWQNIPYNSTELILQPDKVTWRRLQNNKRASGLFMTIACVAWENTNGSLLRAHRRRIRITNAASSFYIFIPYVENECAPFIPYLPNTDQLSYGNCMIQDGYDWGLLQSNAYLDMRVEVWHNAEVPIRIMAEGFHGPLLMSTKLAEYEI